LSNAGIIVTVRIRKARKADFPQILKLARSYDLDYSGMDADDYWVAEEEGLIRGICGRKKHPDCLELCSLGVDESYRSRGLARQLVLALLRETNEDIYLATVIPGFFGRFGFVGARRLPASMIKKSEWCTGCSRQGCTVMTRKGG
jgi:N-acetylglutamate synthase-like GNAT family acetyltransferase